MTKPHRGHSRVIRPLLLLVLAIPCFVSLAQAVTPITSSGLNTHIGAPTTLPGGETMYDITGGTRPGGGTNLFHSFGDFNVPNHNIANFLNDSGLATSNILGRVTGGNVSNIFGTIQTTGFGNANLFLINPAGFLFGPTATVNVGGMVTFSSANYLKLADGVRFTASPSASADLLLSTAPVAAFGFLGSNPGAITVQGSQITVVDGAGISLVGGNIAVQAGTLTAPSGQINLVSVGKLSHPKVGGEVVIAGAGPEAGFTPTGFQSLGTINLSQGSTVEASAPASSGNVAGSVVIRGGQFVMNDSSLQAVVTGYRPDTDTGRSGGSIEVTAKQVTLSNHSTIDTTATSSAYFNPGTPGHITFNVGTFSATDSTILAEGSDALGGGAVTIQGIQGLESFAHAVSLTNTEVATGILDRGPFGGPILIKADNIALNQSTLNALGFQGGPITLVSRGSLDMQNSTLINGTVFAIGGPIDLTAGTSINLTSATINAGGTIGGSITMAAPVISLSGSSLSVGTDGGPAGTISLTGTKAVSLSGSTLDASSELLLGGTIQIHGGAFTSQQSRMFVGSLATGGTIQIHATTVKLIDSQLNASVFEGQPAGMITIDAKTTSLTNSQILSTNFGGPGGTIAITSPKFQQDAQSVIDASSQSGTNGTVTINGVIQP
jgi:filamentous hemagglutinin family protein